MIAYGMIADRDATVPTSERIIENTAPVGCPPPSLPTASARRRNQAERPHPANDDMRRRAPSSIAQTSAILEESLSKSQFWVSAIGVNLVFWLWALFGA